MNTESENEPSSTQSSNPQVAVSQLHSNGRTSTIPTQKTIKLLALGVVSCAIPVIFFIQANELKRAQSNKDSTAIGSQINSDTSLLHAKIKAYETYIMQLKKLSLETFKDDSKNKLDSIISILNGIKSNVKPIRLKGSNIGRPSAKGTPAADSTFRKTIEELKAEIRKQDSLARNDQNINFNKLTSAIASLGSQLQNLKPTTYPSDTLRLRRMQAFETALDGIGIIAKIDNQDTALPRRQKSAVDRAMLRKISEVVEDMRKAGKIR
ncbi:MAG: hypothetical protein ACO1N1_09235 [Dyadobacter fermentans]